MAMCLPHVTGRTERFEYRCDTFPITKPGENAFHRPPQITCIELRILIAP